MAVTSHSRHFIISRPHHLAGRPLCRRQPTPLFSDDYLRTSKPYSYTSLYIINPRARSLNSDNAPISSKTRLVLPFKNGCPLAVSSLSPAGDGYVPSWSLGWLGVGVFWSCLARFGVEFEEEMLVYLDSSYWAADVTLVCESSEMEWEDGQRSCFIDLRTLMVAADWTDEQRIKELAIAGRGKAILEWHNTTRFCGYCGTRTAPIDSGRRKKCTNELCMRRFYPRVDPVVIMLVIDEERDRVLLSRQSRYAPQRWTCLAGFMEPGESLEDAVRRETLEETGIEVDQIIYHGSRPWPIGRNSMPCQLMVGFFAYAKTFEILVNKLELEDAKWHCREEVKKALNYADFHKARSSAAATVVQMCRDGEKSQVTPSDANVASQEVPPMSVPGPYAIAHHLISSSVYYQ